MSIAAFPYHKLPTDYQRWGLVEPEHPDFFLPLVADMWAADIVTIFSGGNKREGADNNIMGSNTPQRFANPNNELIIVGSVDKYGLPSRFNKEVGPAPGAIGRDLQLTGEYTVYAMGEDVDVIVAGSQNGYRKATGNSASAPQIAGLAAYLLRLPGILWPPGQVPKVTTLSRRSLRCASVHLQDLESHEDGMLNTQRYQTTLEESSGASRTARVKRSLSSKMGISLIRSIPTRLVDPFCSP